MTRAHWLKAVGHARGPLPEQWLRDGRADLLSRTGFPRRPRLAPGDRLVYYASVWRRVCAVVEVTGEPTDDVPHATDPARWPWSVPVTALLVVPVLEVVLVLLGQPLRAVGARHVPVVRAATLREHLARAWGARSAEIRRGPPRLSRDPHLAHPRSSAPPRRESS